MTFDLEFTPTRRTTEAVVVFDVLRMTTTACAAFARGLRSLEVVADADAARERARATGALLFGERDGVPLAGFDGGNSPIETLALDLEGRAAVLCTTNGSRAVEAAARARHVLLGAVVNAAAVARFLLALGPDDVLLSCAGTVDRVSFDDVLGAAWVLREVVAREPSVALSDACALALAAVEGHDDPLPLLERAAHARYLRSIGFGEDVAFAARASAFDVVPWRHAASPPAFVVGHASASE
ncbi:MAG: 2-phosphosulfolactate phosphatase [Trueperaceae bacterium]